MIRFTALHHPAALLKKRMFIYYSQVKAFIVNLYIHQRFYFLNILTNHAIVNILFQTLSFNESKQLLHPSDGAFCRASAQSHDNQRLP